MGELFIVFVFALLVLTVVMVIWAILDIFQRNLILSEKLLWTILIISAPILGSLIYFTLGKRKERSF